CVRGKQVCEPYPKKSETVIGEINNLVVVNTWGEAPIQGLEGEQYFWVFTD
ncbi:hypothetical protein C8Q77DRAFT_1040917, partial [Trametes polyzona]